MQKRDRDGWEVERDVETRLIKAVRTRPQVEQHRAIIAGFCRLLANDIGDSDRC